MKPFDKIRALEMVIDCHEFDPFPPISDDFATSTDQVSKKKTRFVFLELIFLVKRKFENLVVKDRTARM